MTGREQQLRRRAPLLLAALATAAATVGVASCKEPTQITLSIRTDALCKSEQFLAPRLNDVAILAAQKLDRAALVPTGTSENCEPPKDRSAPDAAAYVGSLVLVPDAAREGSQVDVLVVAGVENDNPKAVDQSKSMTSAACLDLIGAGTPITGTACIVARRNVGFVDNLPLVLPIELERDCIGKECGEDQTCFHGNCVSATLDCSGADAGTPACEPSAACAQPCDLVCDWLESSCVDGACVCGKCDEALCAGHCDLEGKDGVCSADGATCACQERCDPAQCTDTCNGACETGGAACVCPSCGPECTAFVCATGEHGACQPDAGCACAASDCSAKDMTTACAFGQIPKQAGADCVCACDETACDGDCLAADVTNSGGQCGAGEACTCFGPCEIPDCAPGEEPLACVDAVQLCSECQDDLCNTFCQTGGQTGDCSGMNGTCLCVDVGPTTVSSASSMGGMGGSTGTLGGMGGSTGTLGGMGGSTGTGSMSCTNAECATQLAGTCGGQGSCPGNTAPCACSMCECPAMDCTSFCQTCEGSGGLGALCTTNPVCACGCDTATCAADCMATGAPGGVCGSTAVGSCQCSCNGPADCASVACPGGTVACSAGKCLCSNPMTCFSFTTFIDATECAGMCPAYCMGQPGCSTGSCSGATCTCGNQ